MHSTASFIAIFSVWIAGIVAILYLFLPSILYSRTTLQAYDSANKDSSIRQQMDIGDTSYVSFSPLAIFEKITK